MGTILVTGASRGIGRGIAEALARAGHRLAVHFNSNAEAARETAAACRSYSGVDAEVFQANIANDDDRRRLVDDVSARFGEIDGLVNNAGIAPRRRDDIVYAQEEVFDEVLRVNLYGPYFLTQLVAQRWLDGGSAAAQVESAQTEESAGAPRAATRRVVFVTSVSAVMVSTSRGEYCVSKAGLAMAAQLYAARLAGEGIGVYEIRPGIVQTDMTAGVTGKYDALIADGLVPQKRWGFPSDTGEAVRAIMDGALDFSPGSVLYTDGGLHISRL